MNIEFKTVGGETVNILTHIYEQKAAHPRCAINVGCDSVSKEGIWWYVLVVSFRYGQSGAHYIFQKTKMRAIRLIQNGKVRPDIFTKLWKEAEISIECAEFLRENGIPINAIEMDYNTVPKWASNRLIGPTVGWAQSLGYTVLTKADAQTAVKAADHICDHI